MLFTSIQWLVFLAIVFVGYHCLPTRARQWFMLGASLYFYSSWSAPFLLLIGGQLLIDWTCGYILARTDDPRQRKLVVTASVAVNLASLCVLNTLTVTDFGGQLDADMTRQNGHDLRPRATEGGGSWPKESRHGRARAPYDLSADRGRGLFADHP